MSDPQDLLGRWLKRVRESTFAHYAAEEHLSCLHYAIGIPASILAAITGTAVFASLEAQVNLEIKIVVGAISIITAILTGLQTFLRLSERAERHRTTAGKYGSIRREIEQLLAFPTHITDQAVEEIRLRLDAVAADAPNVSKATWDTATKRADDDFLFSQPGSARTAPSDH